MPEKKDQSEVEAARAAALQQLELAFIDLGNEMRKRHVAASEIVAPGLAPGSYKLLLMIGRLGPITMSEIAERLDADKGMVSRSITELEDFKLVERVPDPKDRRARLIVKTDFGRERMAAAHEQSSLQLEEVLATWPIASVELATELLRALVAGPPSTRPVED